MAESAEQLIQLGEILAAWLAKRFFGQTESSVAGTVLDWAKGSVPDLMDRRRAERQFEQFADQIIQKLQESIDVRRRTMPELDADAVLNELSITLESGVTDHFLTAKEPEPRLVDAELQQQRPLPATQLPETETAVYGQILQETVRYLIEVASVLPRFEPTVARENLNRLNHLGQDVADVLQTVRRLETATTVPGAGADARYEADYRAAVIRGLDRVDLFGADIPPENQRNLLTEAFVTLNVDKTWNEPILTNLHMRLEELINAGSVPTGTDEADSESADDTETDIDPNQGMENRQKIRTRSSITCDELFGSLTSTSSRILIRGSAGCGKTTLLRWAAITASQHHPFGRKIRAGSGRQELFSGLSRSQIFMPASSSQTALHQAAKRFQTTLIVDDSDVAHGRKIRAGSERQELLSGRSGFPIVTPVSSSEAALRQAAKWISHTFTVTDSDAAHDIGELVPWKTSTIQEFEKIARAFRNSHAVRASWRSRIPFYIPLRHCQTGRLPEPDELPRLIANEIGKPPKDWVRSVLTEGRAIVMLDGVDEVPEQNRAALRDEIAAILQAYPECYFVLTSRPTAVADEWNEWLTEMKFRTADISPLSIPEVERFVDRWHDATSKELARQGKPDSGLAKAAEHLLEQFRQNPGLSLLATNPLLCAMICALHRSRNQRLPESQYELCETLCHMLLHKRERESHLNWEAFPEAYIALTYEQKRGITQQLAWWLQKNGQSAMPIEIAYQTVAGALQRIPGRTPDEAPLILKALVERSGLLREPNPDLVDFLHNTFKELLAGDDVAVRMDIDAISENMVDEGWRRVGLFAVASPRSNSFASNLVERLLLNCWDGVANTDSAKARKGRKPALGPRLMKAAIRKDNGKLTIVLFLLQCRQIASFLDAPQKRQVDKLSNVPYPPVDFDSAEAIARLGDNAVEPLVNAKRKDPEENSATARALRLINSEKSRAALQATFVDSEDWNVIAEVAQVVDPLTIPIVLAHVQKLHWRSEIPDSVRKMISDLSTLSTLTALQLLDLSHTSVSDVSALSTLSGLQWLGLSQTSVSEVSSLSTLRGLRHLALSHTSVSDLSALCTLSGLQWLDLSQTSVCDLSALSTLGGLRHLDLSQTRVSDGSALSTLSGLQWLDLSQTRVSDLSALSTLSGLQHLSLWSTRVSDLSALSTLSGLQHLSLWSTSVSDLSALSTLSGLQQLDLSHTSVSDLSAMEHLTNLTILGFDADLSHKARGRKGITGELG